MASERHWQPGVGVLHWIWGTHAAESSEGRDPMPAEDIDEHLLLVTALAGARREYDVILLDTPGDDVGYDPALYAADYPLIPLTPQGTAAKRSLPSVYGDFLEVAKDRALRHLSPLRLAGVVFFPADSSVSCEPEYVKARHPELLKHVFPAALPREDQVGRFPHQLCAPKKPMRRAVVSLTDEIATRVQLQTPSYCRDTLSPCYPVRLGTCRLASGHVPCSPDWGRPFDNIPVTLVVQQVHGPCGPCTC